MKKHNLKIGQRVCVLDSSLEGEIKAINGQKITILDSDGFESVFFDYKLTPKFEEILIEIEEKDIQFTAERRIERRETVDLHLHSYHFKKFNITPKEALQKQLNILREALAESKKAKIDVLEIIHGKGEGILRAEVLKILENTAGTIEHFNQNLGMVVFRFA